MFLVLNLVTPFSSLLPSFSYVFVKFFRNRCVFICYFWLHRSLLLMCAFSSCEERGPFLPAMWHELLTAVASCCGTRGLCAHGSVVAAHGLSSCSLLALGCMGFKKRGTGAHLLRLRVTSMCSEVVACGLSCTRHENFRGPGLNPCPCIGRQIPIHCTTREFLFCSILNNICDYRNIMDKRYNTKKIF